MKKIFLLVVTLLLAAIASSAAANTLGAAKTDVGYDVRQEVRDVPLTKDGLYTVRLLSARDGDSAFDRALILAVEDADGTETLFDLGDIAGYEARFSVEKFAGKDKAELFLSMNSGGSGGYGCYYVVSFDGRSARVLYDSMRDALPSHVTGKFVDGYRCIVRTHGEADGAVIDLSPRKSLYDREGVYNPAGGKLLKAVDIWCGSYGEMTPTKHRGLDGTSALRGTVAYSGLFHADRILTVTITQSYDKGRWHAVAYEIKPWGDLKILQ